mmetsp:Transcript_21407/g.41979  ORF Transcript_21407/g.41979 Transcript_21407/m.41979 type:complete len:658 (-) Transcript_21407:228-2201(-)|eukprot:CAMPEP_0171488636 /NCGR_PEP_ID=MMETSP0958-20121227/2308_1 /TAXON_ID=87120 /ORGANISM="Aurantiochytrium limacinum, Strain ATCCMYA-1381" /LENGTH=657 /DNA_ID=CAMNT_0012021753 /DNA_START=296 /DNA_END=2269 /DNA_ORIENTATION=+
MGPTRASLVLAIVSSALISTASASSAVVYGRISSSGHEFSGEMANVGSATALATHLDDAEGLLLVSDASDDQACSGSNATTTDPLASSGVKTALVALRGGCTFATKLEAAEALGATALLVVNSVDNLYGSNGTDSAYLLDPCDTNCDAAENSDEFECERDCATGLCLANPRAVAGVESGTFCCAVNELIAMSLGSSSKVQAIFVGVTDASYVQEAAATGSGKVYLASKEPVHVDGSMFMILLIGSVVVSISAFRAARKERHEADWLWRKDRSTRNATVEDADQLEAPTDHDDAIDQVTLTLSAVACFLVMCTVILVGLFFLARYYPRETVIFIQVLFGLSAIFAFSHFVLQPLVRKAWPGSVNKVLHLPRGITLGNAAEVIGALLSLGFVVVWFVERHTSWAWVLADILAASVCCMFLVAVRLPNLRLACLMLSLFFVYDIFMVFISPSIFGGESVMVEVATAGGSTASVDPEDSTVCERTQSERMPMLFLVPHFDSPGSYALLGLGDVFIPGLLITFACRFDYLKALKANTPTTFLRVHAYFFPLCVAYFVALGATLVANLFNINFSTQVEGQPALLYLVPCTVGTFVVLAWIRGDLRSLWTYSYEELYEQMISKPRTLPSRASNASTDSDSALIPPANQEGTTTTTGISRREHST